MIKYRNRLISSKLIYGIAISMAIIGILFITIKMFSKVELSKTVKQVQSIDTAKVQFVSMKKSSSKITSRGETVIRGTTNKNEKSTQTKTDKETAKSTSKNVKEKVTIKQKKDSNSKKENKKSTTKYITIGQVKISKFMDLTKRTGLSRKDFIKLISSVRADTSGFFENNAGKIYDLCEKYSINEIFFCGLISAESGWNIASNHRRTHNYISLMKGGKLINYSSVNQGLEVAAQKLHYNYLTPGGKFYHGKTLTGVKTCFCPSGTWVNLVYGRMNQIV